MELRGEARNVGEDWAFTGEVRGSLVFVGNRLYATRPIGSSFVLVDTLQGQDVEIYENRRSAGRTSSGGKAFLPFVQSYSPRSVGLNPSTLAADMLPNERSRTSPLLQASPVCSFPSGGLSRRVPCWLMDREASGRPAAKVARFRERSGEVRGIIGKRGVAYMVDLEAGEPLLVISGERNCSLNIELPRDAQGVLDLGVMTCG